MKQTFVELCPEQKSGDHFVTIRIGGKSMYKSPQIEEHFSEFLSFSFSVIYFDFNFRDDFDTKDESKQIQQRRSSSLDCGKTGQMFKVRASVAQICGLRNRKIASGTIYCIWRSTSNERSEFQERIGQLASQQSDQKSRRNSSIFVLPRLTFVMFRFGSSEVSFQSDHPLLNHHKKKKDF